MKDKEPKPLRKEAIEFLEKVTDPLQTTEKSNQGMIFGGQYMNPRPELTPEQQKDLTEKIKNIRLHKS